MEFGRAPFEGDPRFFCFFLSKVFHCEREHPCFTKDVSSVVTAPCRCGVLTLWRGKAGFGWATYRREHDPTPGWSGGSSRRKRTVAKENGASLDWIILLDLIVVVAIAAVVEQLFIMWNNSS